MIDAQPQRAAGTLEESLQQSVRSRNKQRQVDRDEQTRRQPRYHVILWDDNDHTVTYVVRMMKAIFGYSRERGLEIADTVNNEGRVICLTTTMEHAELKRDQIHAFGKDDLVDMCAGSMQSTIEPEAHE